MAFKPEKDHSLFRSTPASIKTRLDEIEMTTPLTDLPRNSKHPLDVHINRNGFKESLHQVDVAVCDADGSVILGMGDLESVIFPRSAMKPLQSIALIELLKTVEDIPEFSDAEVSLICASHNGELLHTEAVRGLLGKFDISVDELVCGAHWSMHQETMVSQVRSMDKPHQVHNNCCLLYTSPSPRDATLSRMPSSA